jgi:hypothetical protein
MKYGTDENDVEAVCREIGRLHDAGNRDELLEIVRELLSTALEDANKLAARVTELQRTLYGRQSERVSPNQLDRAFAVQANEDPPQDTRGPTPPGAARLLVAGPRAQLRARPYADLLAAKRDVSTRGMGLGADVLAGCRGFAADVCTDMAQVVSPTERLLDLVEVGKGAAGSTHACGSSAMHGSGIIAIRVAARLNRARASLDSAVSPPGWSARPQSVTPVVRSRLARSTCAALQAHRRPAVLLVRVTLPGARTSALHVAATGLGRAGCDRLLHAVAPGLQG